MNGSASLSEKTAIRSARSPSVTVSSSATQSRVGGSGRRLIMPGPRGVQQPGQGPALGTSTQSVSKNASCTTR